MASLTVAVAYESVVKRANYILEMSQNDEYFNRRGVTKSSCGFPMFHFGNASKISTVLNIQNTALHNQQS